MVSIVRGTRTVLFVFLVLFIGAQFVRPNRTNPPSPGGGSLLSKATSGDCGIIASIPGASDGSVRLRMISSAMRFVTS